MPTTKSSIKNVQALTFNVIGLAVLPYLLSGNPGVERNVSRRSVFINHYLPAWQEPKTDTISLSIVGDMMVGSNYPSANMLPPEAEGNILQHAIPYLQQTDLRIGNLESAIADTLQDPPMALLLHAGKHFKAAKDNNDQRRPSVSLAH